MTDPRTSETFDYRNKGHVITSFVVAPANAPAWTQDREQVWGRAELAEKRQDAQVAREWLITIPRDLPVNAWEPFTREAIAPWVEAGAIADVALHCPLDMYGQPQPHAHIMLTMRKLDGTTPTGFAAKKNADLEAMHASGGRYGGERGDALKIQRERIAGVMNTYLAAANSPRRVSHLSNAARGLEAEPEPTMGEQRVRKSHRLRKGDRVTDAVADHRKARALNNALTTVEEEIMSEFPRMQSDAENGIRPAHQQSYKARLMGERLSGVSVDQEQLYMVDVKAPGRTRIQMRDGGWLEVDHAARQATVYGPKGQADTLAKAVIAAGHAEDVARLEEHAAITKRGQKPRNRRVPQADGNIPESWKLPETAVESIADKWRSRGYTNVIEAPDGVYVTLGATRVQDLGTEVRIHGKASDPAISALLAKAADEWGGELEAYGSQEFKDALWLEAQRQGVKVFDQSGKPYEPSPDIRAKYEADRAKLDAQKLDLEGVRQRKKVSDLMQEAAHGSKEALADLKERDGYLWALLTNFDTEQLDAFKQEPVAWIEENLEGLRAQGREIEAEGAESSSSNFDFASDQTEDPDLEDGFDFVDEHERQPEPERPRP